MTTPVEQALVHHAERSERIAYGTVAGFLVAVGVACAVLGVSMSATSGETGAIIAASAVTWGLAGGVWWAYHKLRVVATDPTSAILIEGLVRPPTPGETARSGGLVVGEQPVVVPRHWLGYLPVGTRQSVRAVEAGTQVLAVSVDHGPSADTEAAVVGVPPTSGEGLIAVGLWSQVLVVSGWEVATEGVPWFVWMVSLGVAAVGVWRVGRLARTLNAAHRAHYDAGARHAEAPGARRHRQLVSLAWLAGGAVGVTVLLSVFLFGFGPLVTVVIAGVAALLVSLRLVVGDTGPPMSGQRPARRPDSSL